MKIEKNVLNAALRVLGKVVCQTSPLEVLRSVRVVGTPGNVRAMATDGSDVVSLAVAAECEGEIDFCVEYRKLREMVRTAKGDIELDGDKIEYPQVAVVPDDAVAIALPKDFCNLLALAAPIVERQDARPSLQGINLSRDGITVTNGKELLNLPCPLDLREDFTLPFPLALLTAKLEGSGTLQVWHEKGSRYFRMEIGNFLWIGKEQPGNFPNWRQVIPSADSFDYEIRLNPTAFPQIIEFLQKVPDAPPTHAVMLKVVGNAVELVPCNNPQLSRKIEAEIIGQPPAVVLALNKFILLRILNQGYDKLKANGHGFAPVMAEGGTGQFIAMPVRINSELNTTTQPVNEKVNKMEEEKRIEVEPMDELNASVEALRMILKQLYDVSVVLNRKVKEASLAQKQKEREYVQAKRAIERIRTAI